LKKGGHAEQEALLYPEKTYRQLAPNRSDVVEMTPPKARHRASVKMKGNVETYRKLKKGGI